jgi:adenosylcobinamide-phosphate synthase
MSAALLAAALVVDAVAGEPRWLWSRLPHPAVLMGRAVGTLDRFANAPPARRAKGVLVVLLLSCAALLTGYLLALAGPVAEIVITAILLAQRSLVQHVSAVATALRLSTGDARQAVSMIVSRDCREMTGSQVARAAIESASENLSDGVIAPAFWFLVAGLPGIILYKVINTADSMIGYRTPRHADFGWAAARCDDVLNLLPARLTGLMIALLSRQFVAWGDIADDARRHRSPNAGWPESAMARALGLALAGPRSYDGRMQDLAWVNGSARRDLGPDDIDASVRMLWRVWILTFGFVIATAVSSTLV